MARQIGKMLNATEPKVVNGPEILSKFVGQSEENIRKLFADAEKEVSVERNDQLGIAAEVRPSLTHSKRKKATSLVCTSSSLTKSMLSVKLEDPSTLEPGLEIRSSINCCQK